MKTLMKSVVIFALAVSAQVGFSASELSVLYWMVNDPAVYGVGGGAPAQKIGDLGSVQGARVKVSDQSGTTAGYLGLIDMDPDSGSYGKSSPIDTTTGFSVEGEDALLWIDGGSPALAGPAMSQIGNDYLSNDYLFTMELGYYDGNGDWFVMAVSNGIGGGDLLDKFVSTDDMIVPGHLDWRPDAFTVPEPSSGMLVLLGCALMGLRRKRRGACAV